MLDIGETTYFPSLPLCSLNSKLLTSVLKLNKGAPFYRFDLKPFSCLYCCWLKSLLSLERMLQYETNNKYEMVQNESVMCFFDTLQELQNQSLRQLQRTLMLLALAAPVDKNMRALMPTVNLIKLALFRDSQSSHWWCCLLMYVM